MSGIIRVGNCSGYYGDRLSAMREMLEGGRLDYLTGDYLAELTMLILGRDRMKDADLGYAKTFVKQMTDSMALAKELGVKIVANAGGLNPAGLAEALRAIATEQGLVVSIAHVEGDDLVDRAEELNFGSVMTANAYLGAFGIASALEGGADVVVTGRVTDASVVVGPAIAQYGWGREDFDQLAGAVVAGHVIECGTQATGGNFSGFTDIDMSTPLGFPIAEISADGAVVITKHGGTGGTVTVDTVTAQLVYEVGSAVYLGPDVSTRLDTMTLTQQGPDRVAIAGVTGEAPPEMTKVCLNAFGGFRNSVEFLLTGLDIAAKADLIRTQMDGALTAGTPPDSIEWQLDRTDVSDPATEAQGTSLLRCHVKSAEPNPVGRAFSDAAIQLALASYPGFSVTRPPAAGTPYGVYRPAYVPQTAVPHVVVAADGTRTDIPPPSTVAPILEDAKLHGPAFLEPSLLEHALLEPVERKEVASTGSTTGVERQLFEPALLEPVERKEVASTSSTTKVERQLLEPALLEPVERKDVVSTGSTSGGASTGSTSGGAEWLAETVRAPLGRLAYARSGDKGGDANVGVWIPADHHDRETAYGWLVDFLDEATVRELLPEAATLDLEIHPLTNLKAVNIVIHGLLGEGVASSTRLDPQAKGLGEWLRARDCAIPTRLLPAPEDLL